MILPTQNYIEKNIRFSPNLANKKKSPTRLFEDYLRSSQKTMVNFNRKGAED